MNISDLGHDLEHCLQLRRQLRQLPGVWAGVRGPCHASLHWEMQLGVVTEPGLWGQMWAFMSSPHLTACMHLGRLLSLPGLSFFIFNMGIPLTS